MANAILKDAPEIKEKSDKELKKELQDKYITMEFDPDRKYMFELATPNPVREIPIYELIGTRSIQTPHRKFKPYQNMIFTSQVIWNGTRRTLRYYDGCNTIFVDEQTKDRDAIKEFIDATPRRAFLDGKVGFFGSETWLIRYMLISSFNGLSPFRTKTAESIWIPSSPDNFLKTENNRLDEIEEAMGYAKTASPLKMKIHAYFLGIPTEDWDSGNLLSEEETRVLYRKEAIKNPGEFIKSFGNRNLELKYYIDKALLDKKINNTFNPNKATWVNSNSEICDISGLKSQDAISQKLFEFAQMSEGEEFALMLRSLYEK